MKFKNFLAVMLSAALLAGSQSTVWASENPTILSAFQNYELDSKPMARMWFIDAMSGAEEDDVIEEMILNMAKGGMGGVELAFLSDFPGISDTSFAKEYGWGSENWIKTLKKVFQAALQVEDGFKVDLTITSHWPPALNTIDPNDQAASAELSSAVTYVTEEDIANGYVTLALPEAKTADGGGNPFIFTDTLVSAVLTDPVGEQEVTYTNFHPMMGETSTTSTVTTFSYDNMQNVTDAVTSEAAYKAGIPDAEALTSWYDSAYTEEEVAAIFGEAPSAETELIDGKRTADGLRARMADTQYSYTLDLSGLNVKAGDAVIGMYYRGTGQIRSGGGSYTMPYITYATNYFAEEGIQEVIDYWEENIFSDPELLDLMKQNAEKTGGMSIFEDSIEASHSTPFWSHNMLSEGSEYLGYDMANAAALVMASDSSTTFVFVDENNEIVDNTRTVEDYDNVLTQLFNRNHMSPAKEWMENLDFDVNYRIQAYGIESMGYVAGALTAGIPEGDNATAGDDNRMLSTAVNLNENNNLLSQEALTTIKQQLTWKLAASDVNYQSSSGINRVIFHGSSYPVCFDENYNSWPGWNWGGMTNYYEGFNSWNSRTAWWDDANIMTGYVSRLQSISQNGKAKVDLVVMTNRDGSSSTFESLLDNGYSYNIMDEEVFREELVDPEVLSVTNGVLCESSAAYRAMVISDLESITVENLTKIIGFAEAGLPIVIQGTLPERIYGTASSEEDAAITDLMNQLSNMENVVSVDTAEELPDALAALHISPAASYSMKGIEASLREDESGRYYKFYNGSGEYAEFTATLKGEGVPFKLNTWDGTIEPLADYIVTEEGITVNLSVEADDMLIIAVAPSNGELASAAGLKTDESITSIEEIKEETANTGGGSFFNSQEEASDNTIKSVEGKYVDNKLVLRSTESKEYKVTTTNDSYTITTPETKKGSELYNWTLTLNSFGPDEEVNGTDPTVSKVTTVEIDNVAAGTAWAQLPTNYAEEFGVTNMNAISGTGVYKTTVTMPDDWDAATDGAYLALTYCENDMLASVTVNGTSITDLNALRDYVDLGHLLNAGENEITVQIDTTLVNRGQYEGGQAKNPMDQRVPDGLMSAELVTYTDIAID